MLTNGNDCKLKYENDEKLRNGYKSSMMICAGKKLDGSDSCTVILLPQFWGEKFEESPHHTKQKPLSIELVYLP